MPLILTAAYHTQTGRREQNEDVVDLVTSAEPQTAARGMIAAISDGVSGSAGGRDAADYSVRRLLADFYATPDDWSVTQALERVIRDIHRSVQQQSTERAAPGKMATTLTALVLRGRTYYFAHVGDTRLYLLRDSAFKCLTTDHVLDQPERRHVLTRAIGLNGPLQIDHGMGELRVGDLFLLASDGVWAALPEDELSWHLATLADKPDQPEATAKLLVDAALAAGSRDNASALVIRIAQLPEQRLQDHVPDPLQRRDWLTRWRIIGAIALAVSLVLLFVRLYLH